MVIFMMSGETVETLYADGVDGGKENADYALDRIGIPELLVFVLYFRI